MNELNFCFACYLGTTTFASHLMEFQMGLHFAATFWRYLFAYFQQEITVEIDFGRFCFWTYVDLNKELRKMLQN